METSGQLVKKEITGTRWDIRAYQSRDRTTTFGSVVSQMEGLAKPAIAAVLENKEVKLVPEKFKNTYRHWMENIRDWNISRQLWWGQQIRLLLWKGQFTICGCQRQKILQLAKAASGDANLRPSDLRQDEDVLDTWFSSWLWPISVFNGVLSLTMLRSIIIIPHRIW